METLVVVHTDLEYLSEDRVGVKHAKINRQLFDRIAFEISCFKDKSFPVYYLAGSTDTGLPELLDLSIREHVSYLRFFPAEVAEKQFLRLKDKLLFYRKPIFLAGLSYYNCIGDIYNLFQANNTKEMSRLYRETAIELNWSQARFEQVLNKKLNVFIKEELTDKF